jgi:hypothetical protein
MRRAQRTLKKFGNSVRRITKRVALYGSALTAAGTIGTAIFVRRQMEALDVLGKVAGKLGIAAGKLAQWHLVARVAGVQIKQFNMALQRMLRRVQEAAAGTGEAQQAIRDLGLDAKELGKLEPSRLLLKFMDALRGRTDRLRMAFKLFDSEGVVMLQIFDQGRERIKALMDYAKRAGVVLSDFDISRIQAANDAVLLLRTAMTGLVNQLTVSVQPIVQSLSSTIANLLVNIDKPDLRRRFINMFVFAATAAGGFLKILADIADRMQVLSSVFEQFRLQSKAMAATVTTGIKAAPSFIKQEAVSRTVQMISFSKRMFRLWQQFRTGASIDIPFAPPAKRIAREFKATKTGKSVVNELIAERRARTDELRKFKASIDDLIAAIVKGAAKALTGAPPGEVLPAVPPGAPLAAPTEAIQRVNRAMQISPTRMWIPGLSNMTGREQRVRDPQLQPIRQILERQNELLAGGMIATAG